LGFRTFPTHDEGCHLIEIAGKRTSYSGAITDARVGLVRDLVKVISPLAMADLKKARARLDRMARQVPPEESWTAPKAGRLGQPPVQRIGQREGEVVVHADAPDGEPCGPTVRASRATVATPSHSGGPDRI
jgi:hypothetical protein